MDGTSIAVIPAKAGIQAVNLVLNKVGNLDSRFRTDSMMELMPVRPVNNEIIETGRGNDEFFISQFLCPG